MGLSARARLRQHGACDRSSICIFTADRAAGSQKKRETPDTTARRRGRSSPDRPAAALLRGASLCPVLPISGLSLAAPCYVVRWCCSHPHTASDTDIAPLRHHHLFFARCNSLSLVRETSRRCLTRSRVVSRHLFLFLPDIAP